MEDYGACNHCPKLLLIEADGQEIIGDIQVVRRLLEDDTVQLDSETLKHAGARLNRLDKELAMVTAFKDAALLCKGVVTADAVEDGEHYEVQICRQPIASRGPAAAFVTRTVVEP